MNFRQSVSSRIRPEDETNGIAAVKLFLQFDFPHVRSVPFSFQQLQDVVLRAIDIEHDGEAEHQSTDSGR